MVNGVFVGFYIPPTIIVLIAIFVAGRQALKGEWRSAVKSFLLTVLIGAIVCIAMLGIYGALYFGAGGH